MIQSFLNQLANAVFFTLIISLVVLPSLWVLDSGLSSYYLSVMFELSM